MSYDKLPYKLTDSYRNNPNRYKDMVYNRCGYSGLKLPAISLGLWQNFGGIDDFMTVTKMICEAFDLGITHFDLANNYGRPPGSAEINFGRVLKHELKSYRDEIIISTKAGYDMWPGPYGVGGSRKYLIASCDQSLKKLGLDYVDIFYSHRFDPDTPLEETMGALAHLVNQGKALYIGISTYSPNQTLEAISILNNLGTPCLVHQASYSLFNRWIENELLEVLDNNGIGCVAFSTLAQGILSNKYLNGVSANSRANRAETSLKPEILSNSIIKNINALSNIAKKRGQTLSQMALAWIQKDQRVTSALIGVSNTEQIRKNIKSLQNVTFSEDELIEIDQYSIDQDINLWAPVEKEKG